MNGKIFVLCVFFNVTVFVSGGGDVLGCGGFVKSHVPIDFSKVLVKLFTVQGILKEQTSCAPNNGYYFIPLYDKGDYILQLEPPPGWSFTPTKVPITIDGKHDLCSQGKDIDFSFNGFGITGKVESYGSKDGPSGISVELISAGEVRKAITGDKGIFFFTPVFPGEYTVAIADKRWKLLKKSINVKVTERNTELEPNLLIIDGYDVSGYVKSADEAVKAVTIVLHAIQDKGDFHTADCDKRPLLEYTNKKDYCYVTTNSEGKFVFPSISNGNYYIEPYHKGQKIHFQPDRIEFSVLHNSVVLDTNFEILGFSISGRVLNTQNGSPLSNVLITLANTGYTTTTNSNGVYHLEKITAGMYTISAASNDYKFDPVTLKVSPSLDKLPDVYPNAYKVCGNVVDDKMQSVFVSMVHKGSSQQFIAKTDSNTGEFCEYLPPGKYDIQVTPVKDVQFFPVTQTVDVVSKPVLNITFSQLKALLTGKINCLTNKDCRQIKIILSTIDSTSEQFVASDEDGTYTIKDVRPGAYKVSLTTNNLCWKEDEHTITVSSTSQTIPTFEQMGYLVKFINSHDTIVTYKNLDENPKEIQIPIGVGTTTHCLTKVGTYNFKLKSCHTYASDTIEYSTLQETNEIVITPIKHHTTISINSSALFGEVYASVGIGSSAKEIHGPLPYSNNKYTLELYLSPGENAIVVPKSDILYFNPPISSITGTDDCADLGPVFEARKGRVFSGTVRPALHGVQITIESETSDILMDETDANGNYKFPPLDDSKRYKIMAKKESYDLIGPDEQGNFLAQKLAEIVVQVMDQVGDTPLQGALLSLSGGDSYRSNLQTNEGGQITFSSLSPGEYFLRPMMKEYNFNPSSKIINVEVGASVKVQLKGKRVAYSVYGLVTSLNGHPEERMIVVAAGLGNCSQYSEEASSEATGTYRIRGLLPYCSYQIKVKGSLDEMSRIERTSPAEVTISDVTEDIYDLHMVVIQPAPTVDLLVKIFTENAEHYKSFRIKVTRESSPASVIQTVKIDTSNYKITQQYNAGVVVQLSSIPLDGKTYTIQAESTISALNKGKAYSRTIVADKSFKYAEFNLVVKNSAIDQHIKQTSVWMLVFIFGVIVAFYNLDHIVKKANFSVPTNGLEQLWKSKVPPPEYVVDNNDIDEIVESINASKKKLKPKRI